MKRPIGYYVHHQGAGHLQRARLIAAATPRPCVLMGTFEAADVLALPDDRLDDTAFSGQDSQASRPDAFHYAPVGLTGLRLRNGLMAAWIAECNPALFIVDVSVEVALFARLMSVPVVVVRLAGLRDDQPHLEAFRAAEALLAPFPEALEHEATAAWVRDKTIYAGFLTSMAPTTSEVSRQQQDIAVVLGRGGSTVTTDLLTAAAAATPRYQWHIYGQAEVGDRLPHNLRFHGWVSDIGAKLDRAVIIIGAAGDGLIAAVAARRKPFICIPEDRPFNEQRDKARRLKALDLCTVLDDWPPGAAWPSILRQAEQLDASRLHALFDPRAPEEVGRHLDTIAGQFETKPDA